MSTVRVLTVIDSEIRVASVDVVRRLFTGDRSLSKHSSELLFLTYM